TNTTDTSVYLDSEQIVGADQGLFTLNSPSFPLILPMDSSVNVSITFQSNATSGEGNYYAALVASVHGTSTDEVPCHSLSVPLGATVAIPIVDSITLDVPPGSNTLSIVAHTTQSRHAIFIKNMESSSILVQGLTIDDTSTGAYFGTPGNKTDNTDDSLSIPAGDMEGPILLTLDEPDTGTYNIDLTLNYVIQQAHKNGSVPTSSSYAYTVIAHRLPPITEGVSEPNAPAAAQFSLMPNPARDEVTIGLPDGGASTVEIYDVLGNLVLHRVAQGNFVWNSETGAGALANGTYIVRVSQGDHTSSKRLVIVR
ncbi:MAG: T9SS type A sorting domain-containing protein, partial [Candidatus Kapaibacterium sp.]